MTIDGFLTLFGILIAAYALAPRVLKLRFGFGLGFQILWAIFAFGLVLYFELFEVVGLPCPRTFGGACSWLELSKWPFTPVQLAFLVVLGWLALALATHWFFSRSRASWSLPVVSSLIDNLLYERRFAEVLDVTERLLPLVDNAINRRLFFQRWHDRLSKMRGINRGGLLSVDQEERKRTAGRSPLSRALRRIVGTLALLVPGARVTQAAAEDIARVLFRSRDLLRHIVETRPYYAVALLNVATHERREFSDAYFRELISDTGSVLYQELRRHPEYAQIGYSIAERYRILHLLLADVRIVKELSVWYTIGESAVNLLDAEQSPAYARQLKRRPRQFYEERWNDPIGVAIVFFDWMVTAAAHQGVQWHMGVYCCPEIVERLERLYDDSDPSVDAGDESPAWSSWLIHEVVLTLCRWILLDELPAESPHRRSEVTAKYQKWQPVRWNLDVNNIPASAAAAIGTCMATVVMSERIGEACKVGICNVVFEAVRSIDLNADERALRNYVIGSIVNGGQLSPGERYGPRLFKLWNMVDHSIRSSLGDFECAMKAVYGNVSEHVP